MRKDIYSEYTRFKNLYNDLKNRSKYRVSNKKSIDIVRDIEILKIKLIDIENYLDAKDIYSIMNYLGSLSYQSDLENFILEKPEKENFWMTIWKYQEHSSENEIVIKISYRRDAFSYNPRSGYTDHSDVYSPCVYTELNILIDYFMNYIFPLLMNRDKNIINPLKFIN